MYIRKYGCGADCCVYNVVLLIYIITHVKTDAPTTTTVSTSGTVSVVKKETLPVQNGLGSQHQPSPPTTNSKQTYIHTCYLLVKDIEVQLTVKFTYIATYTGKVTYGIKF